MASLHEHVSRDHRSCCRAYSKCYPLSLAARASRFLGGFQLGESEAWVERMPWSALICQRETAVFIRLCPIRLRSLVPVRIMLRCLCQIHEACNRQIQLELASLFQLHLEHPSLLWVEYRCEPHFR